MVSFRFHSNEECFKVKFLIYFRDIHFTRNDYFLKNSRYTISSAKEKKKKNKIKNQTFIQQIDQLSRLTIDESMKFSTHLYRDIPSKYLEIYLPKYRKIIIRQKTKLNEFETLIRDVGYIELALHDLIKERSPMHYEFDLYDPDNGAEAVIRIMIQHRIIPLTRKSSTSSSLKSILSFFKKPKEYNVISRHEKNQEFFDVLLRKDSTGRMSMDEDDDDDNDSDVHAYSASDYDLSAKLDFNRPDSFFIDNSAATSVDQLIPHQARFPSEDERDAKAGSSGSLGKSLKVSSTSSKEAKRQLEADDDEPISFGLEEDAIGSIGFSDADFRIAELTSRNLPPTPLQPVKSWHDADRELTPKSIDLMKAVEDIEFEMNEGGYNRLSVVPPMIDTTGDGDDAAGSNSNRINYSLSYSHSPTYGASHGRKAYISDDENSELDYDDRFSDKDRNSGRFDATLAAKMLTVVPEENEDSSDDEEVSNRPSKPVKLNHNIIKEVSSEKRSTHVVEKEEPASTQSQPRVAAFRSSSKRLEGKKSESESFGVTLDDWED